MSTLPEEIITARLLLRPWIPEDRPAYEQVVTGSADHLRPWLPWARFPTEELWQELQDFLQKPGSANDVLYALLSRDKSGLLGGVGVHDRGESHEREIGYWLRREAVGEGFMTEAVTGVTSAVFAALPVSSVTIICHPANVRSAGVPRRAGYDLEGIFPVRVITPDRTENMIWRITREAWSRRCMGIVV